MKTTVKLAILIFLVVLIGLPMITINIYAPKSLGIIKKDTIEKLLNMNSSYPWHFEYKIIKTYVGSLKLIWGIHPGYINASRLVQGSPYLYTIVIGKVFENISLPIVTGFTIEVVDVVCSDRYFSIGYPTDYWWNIGDHILMKILLVKCGNPPEGYILTIRVRFKVYALMFAGYFPVQVIEHEIRLKVEY